VDSEALERAKPTHSVTHANNATLETLRNHLAYESRHTLKHTDG
jgi:hypothetical protein